jgi:hypothetical protein
MAGSVQKLSRTLRTEASTWIVGSRIEHIECIVLVCFFIHITTQQSKMEKGGGQSRRAVTMDNDIESAGWRNGDKISCERMR